MSFSTPRGGICSALFLGLTVETRPVGAFDFYLRSYPGLPRLGLSNPAPLGLSRWNQLKGWSHRLNYPTPRMINSQRSTDVRLASSVGRVSQSLFVGVVGRAIRPLRLGPLPADCSLRSAARGVVTSCGSTAHHEDFPGRSVAEESHDHFPKSKADPVDSLACARYAIVERPPASYSTPPEFIPLRDLAGALESQSQQTTRGINQLHAHLARVFPELAALAPHISAGWVLTLLDKYPTPERIAAAHTDSLVTVSRGTGQLLRHLPRAGFVRRRQAGKAAACRRLPHEPERQ